MVAVRNFTKFLTPPLLSFNLETMSSNSPSPMEEKPVHPLVLPDTDIPLPWGKPRYSPDVPTNQQNILFVDRIW